MEYQNDYILRLVEQMGSLIRLAFLKFRDGEGVSGSLALSDEAIAMVVDMDAEFFLRLSPQSMVSFVEISSYDDRIVAKLAEALGLQADLYESEGSLIEAGVRREQAAAVLSSMDPDRAN